MTIQELTARKKELGYSYKKISELSGVPIGTVQKILGGFTANPRYETLLAIERALCPAVPLYQRDSAAGNTIPGEVCEPTPVYGSSAPAMSQEELPPSASKKQGEFTAADRELFPEERRTELIDGVIYDMASPTMLHQIILGNIFVQFSNYIYQRGGKCTPIMAPSDVFLDGDDRTVVQPDLYIICDEKRLLEKDLKGGPDLVVEVLSPSTKKKDMLLKAHKYQNAGVREYWMVDPEKKKVIVWIFKEDPDVFIYGFDSKIPVSIYGGDCEIDFTQIYERCKIWYE